MALSFVTSKANVLRHFYTVYMRETTTVIAAADYADLAGWNTFIATMNAIGSCENEQVKIDEVPLVVPIDYGEERVYAYDGNIEIKYLQNLVVDFTDIDDLRTHDCDLLLVDSINKIFVYVHDKRFLVEKHVRSGQIAHFIIKALQTAGQRSGLYATMYLVGTIPIA